MTSFAIGSRVRPLNQGEDTRGIIDWTLGLIAAKSACKFAGIAVLLFPRSSQLLGLSRSLIQLPSQPSPLLLGRLKSALIMYA
jgi:hypothetical protein